MSTRLIVRCFYDDLECIMERTFPESELSYPHLLAKAIIWENDWCPGSLEDVNVYVNEMNPSHLVAHYDYL